MQPIATVIDRADLRQRSDGQPTATDDSYSDLRQFRRAQLSDLDTSVHPRVAQAVEAARTWGRRYNSGSTPAPWLILSGPNGAGKSHIARAIWGAFHYSFKPMADYEYGPGWQARHIPAGGVVAGPGARAVVIERPTGRFWAAADLLEEMAVRGDTGISIRVGSIVGSAPIVVIDDVGAEGVLEFIGKEYQDSERQARYFRFIDYCYANEIPGVITTNLTLTELAAHLGRRAWDRLMQMAPAGQMVDMSGVPSWRVRAGGR